MHEAEVLVVGHVLQAFLQEGGGVVGLAAVGRVEKGIGHGNAKSLFQIAIQVVRVVSTGISNVSIVLQ